MTITLTAAGTTTAAITIRDDATTAAVTIPDGIATMAATTTEGALGIATTLRMVTIHRILLTRRIPIIIDV